MVSCSPERPASKSASPPAMTPRTPASHTPTAICPAPQVCYDVIVRAGRDALSLDLQKLVHENMLLDFTAYPRTWGAQHPDTNIDHRRVPNLETYWKRTGCELWYARSTTLGNGFPDPLAVGDILTWRLSARWPHIGIVVADSLFSTRIVHNWGNGAEESSLLTFLPHRAIGHYRWPTT